MEALKEFYRAGDVTKGEFERALREHKESRDEMSSEQRSAARVFGAI